MFLRLLLPDGAPVNLSYEEWGDRQSPRVLFCVHGLTRNAMDFEVIGKAAAAAGFRMIAPDMPGRGKSENIKNPLLYNNAVYANLCLQMLGILGIRHVDWLGTSMGGIIAIIVANQAPGLIERLVLNDVGMVVTGASLARIGEYVGLAPSFATFEEAEAQLKIRTQPFSIPEGEWKRFAQNSIVPQNGGWRLCYDPAIGEAFKLAPPKDIELWQFWKAVKLIPTLLIRGEHSDLLTEEVAQKMKDTHPMLTRYDVAGAGHAPALMTQAEIGTILGFLGRYRSAGMRISLRLMRAISPQNQAVKLQKLYSLIRRR